MKFIHWRLKSKKTLDCNGGYQFQLKWLEVTIVIVLTRGYQFWLQCHFQLVFVNSYGQQLEKKFIVKKVILNCNYNWTYVVNLVGKKGVF
jgi:hypothetical protein